MIVTSQKKENFDSHHFHIIYIKKLYSKSTIIIIIGNKVKFEEYHLEPWCYRRETSL